MGSQVKIGLLKDAYATINEMRERQWQCLPLAQLITPFELQSEKKWHD